MGLFDKFLKKEEEINLPALEVADDEIVALADGELIDIATVPDPVFAEQMMGKTCAFKYGEGKVVLCAPANGTLGVLFDVLQPIFIIKQGAVNEDMLITSSNVRQNYTDAYAHPAGLQ